jgi:hypothetical protein
MFSDGKPQTLVDVWGSFETTTNVSEVTTPLAGTYSANSRQIDALAARERVLYTRHNINDRDWSRVSVVRHVALCAASVCTASDYYAVDNEMQTGMDLKLRPDVWNVVDSDDAGRQVAQNTLQARFMEVVHNIHAPTDQDIAVAFNNPVLPAAVALSYTTTCKRTIETARTSDVLIPVAFNSLVHLHQRLALPAGGIDRIRSKFYRLVTARADLQVSLRSELLSHRVIWDVFYCILITRALPNPIAGELRSIYAFLSSAADLDRRPRPMVNLHTTPKAETSLEKCEAHLFAVSRLLSVDVQQHNNLRDRAYFNKMLVCEARSVAQIDQLLNAALAQLTQLCATDHSYFVKTTTKLRTMMANLKPL